MIYKNFVHHVAKQLDISDAEARRVLAGVFTLLRDSVLAGQRVAVPQFGTFHRRTTREGTRRMGSVKVEVPESHHVRFRSAKAAKARAH